MSTTPPESNAAKLARIESKIDALAKKVDGIAATGVPEATVVGWVRKALHH